jgi:hypothetical protein
MRVCLDLPILCVAALLVPRSERPEWRREWKSELWYAHRHERKTVMFCLGAFKDALWMRRNCPRAEGEKILSLQSPLHCVLLLAFLAALATFLGFSLPGPRDMLRSAPVFVHFLLLGVALLILPIATPLSLGDYPVTAHSPRRTIRFRRWMFLVAKIVCVLPVVFFGTLDAAGLIGVTGIQPDVALAGYVLAFRWVLKDQRQRCPVCLRLLTNPTRIGRRSQLLLDWHGTELMCERGHGMLYVPEVTGSYSAPRWLYLDPSWQSLFL